ncbi:MAG: bifunctional demethylmenaquinone methyltransferase/2-methoxy-6-polyprenyl-1,4-benzoquinol methylase UbiE [Phycisphaerae bacterium]|nr:bifunctional demethylmenaquinone methyltransferase/2-methoxy-6-polyprenyl-1,4-benzoquinol methylase UbiE [Phycisphaerae bacterium]
MTPGETNFAADMFGLIAPVYDFLNHLLSFGQDYFWRRKAASYLDEYKNITLIDLATGTGDILTALLRRRNDIKRAVGLDISKEMLTVCRKKLNWLDFSDKVELICGDASRTPFEDNSFDAVTMAFGIRNMPDVPAVLKEIRRILKPAGKMLILEFAIPSNLFIRNIYLLYLKILLPLIAGLVSGDSRPYRYLGRSIESFYSPSEFLDCMIDAGFENAAVRPLSLGVACIYSAVKP